MRSLRDQQPEDNVNRYIRKRIRDAREDRGMIQADLAAFLGKSRVALSDIERGRVKVSASDLALLATALEKPVSYFYPPPDRGLETNELAPEEKELVHCFRQIGHKPLQAIALKQVSAFADAVIAAELMEADLEVKHRSDEDGFQRTEA